MIDEIPPLAEQRPIVAKVEQLTAWWTRWSNNSPPPAPPPPTPLAAAVAELTSAA